MARSRASARQRPATPRPTVLRLVGASGLGKTTLAERLIARWTQAGLSVGYVKHAAHGFDLDQPGKDSFRAGAAGASGVCLLGPTRLAYLETAAGGRPEDLIARFFHDRDVVLVEGFHLTAVPALLFVGAWGARGAPSPKPSPRGRVLARIVAGAAGATRAAGRTPVLARDDVEGILRLVQARLGVGRRAGRQRRRAVR